MTNRIWRVVMLGALLGGLAGVPRGRAQSKPDPMFEVASIRAAEPSKDGRVSVSMNSDRGRVNYRNVTLTQVLQAAYGVRRHQIAGPSWLDDDRFDIVANYRERRGQ